MTAAPLLHRHCHGCAELQRLHLAAEQSGSIQGDGRLTTMFSLPFISCFSHLDSEIPGMFLSVLLLSRRQAYSSHAEKYTKSSNLSSLPLLFCHTRLNCISSATLASSTTLMTSSGKVSSDSLPANSWQLINNDKIGENYFLRIQQSQS